MEELVKNGDIYYRRWQAPFPKAVVLLVHGLGAHSARWQFLADFFLQRAVSSYAIELKGFGKTETLKGHIDNFNIYIDDIERLCGIIRKESPWKKIFILGESMGSLIAFLTAASKPAIFGGLICISPAFKARRMKFTMLEYADIFLSLIFNPRKQFTTPFDPSMCTRDVEYQKVLEADSLDHHLATAKLLWNVIAAQIRSNFVKDKINIPVLFLLSGKDLLVVPRASRRIFKALKPKDKSIVEYPDMYHALSIELDREKVFVDIFNWIKERI